MPPQASKSAADVADAPRAKWLCAACGAGYDTKLEPARCRKCGSHAFEPTGAMRTEVLTRHTERILAGRERSADEPQGSSTTRTEAMEAEPHRVAESPGKGICRMPDCQKPRKTRGLCDTHYFHLTRGADPQRRAEAEEHALPSTRKRRSASAAKPGPKPGRIARAAGTKAAAGRSLPASLLEAVGVAVLPWDGGSLIAGRHGAVLWMNAAGEVHEVEVKVGRRLPL